MVDRRIERREFLTKAWKVGAGMITVAGAWTTWDILRPGTVAGSLGPLKTIPMSGVPADSPLEIAAVRGYLTSVDGEVLALSWKCPHLGCKVRWIEGEDQFFCPCHNAIFDRDGDVVTGPPPRPLDRYPVKVEDDQIYIQGV